jgi:hypothetical protein
VLDEGADVDVNVAVDIDDAEVGVLKSLFTSTLNGAEIDISFLEVFSISRKNIEHVGMHFGYRDREKRTTKNYH